MHDEGSLAPSVNGFRVRMEKSVPVEVLEDRGKAALLE